MLLNCCKGEVAAVLSLLFVLFRFIFNSCRMLIYADMVCFVFYVFFPNLVPVFVSPDSVGLEIDGLRSANGVAPSIPGGKALLQGRAGLRLYKAKPKEPGIKEGVIWCGKKACLNKIFQNSSNMFKGSKIKRDRLLQQGIC